MVKSITVKIYNQTGQSASEVKLDPKVFSIEINEPLVHQAAVTQLANKRHNLAHTKTRGEVRGGGRKPWRQKGTGRARHGSIRSPIWRGGGITFGPLAVRNFSKKINKKAKQKAVCMVLTDRAQNKSITILEDLKITEYKTKDLIKILSRLLGHKQSSLIILPKTDQKIYRSAQNVPNLQTILADSLNVVTLLKYDRLIILKNSLKIISDTFAK